MFVSCSVVETHCKCTRHVWEKRFGSKLQRKVAVHIPSADLLPKNPCEKSPDRNGTALEGDASASAFDNLQAKTGAESNGAFVFFGLARNEVLNSPIITRVHNIVHMRFQVSV